MNLMPALVEEDEEEVLEAAEGKEMAVAAGVGEDEMAAAEAVCCGDE